MKITFKLLHEHWMVKYEGVSEEGFYRSKARPKALALIAINIGSEEYYISCYVYFYMDSIDEVYTIDTLNIIKGKPIDKWLFKEIIREMYER